MKRKDISVVFYGRRFPKPDWRYDLEDRVLEDFFSEFRSDLSPLGIALNHLKDEEVVLDVKGYGDLLNCVRIRSPKDGIFNLCLGHIIGKSPRRDLFEDIRRGVNRVAFAPETIEPEGSDKIVCHNCGCGC